MVDSHLNPSLSSLQPATDPLRGEAERALRGVENERMMRQIAGRICESSRHRSRERKHTKTFLQPLGLPVLVEGKLMRCAVRQTFLLSHPREHETVTFWFESVELARERFPEAKLLRLPNYDRVQAQKAGRA